MVAKISVGKSLYGALAYNGEKINGAKGRLLTTNRIYNDGTGTVDIRKAMEGFLACMPEHTRVEKPVLHISLNPHPDDVLTDMELQDIAREYLEKLGYGNQPYLVVKHEDIDRHHLHIVTINVDEKGRRLNQDFLFRRSDRIRKIVVESGRGQLNGWRHYERDVRADFERAFGEPSGPLTSLAYMTDADNTQGRAEACYGPARLF